MSVMMKECWTQLGSPVFTMRSVLVMAPTSLVPVYLAMRTTPPPTTTTALVSTIISYSLQILVLCVDIDECDDESTTCPVNSHCSNILGGYECICDDGYFVNGSDCCKLHTATIILNRVN